jgi:hypothetical protein
MKTEASPGKGFLLPAVSRPEGRKPVFYGPELFLKPGLFL